MILRLFDEINQAIVTNGSEAVPLPKGNHTGDEEIIASIPRFLEAASINVYFYYLLIHIPCSNKGFFVQGGMAIIFDAINQLPSKYQSLHWLPNRLPPFISVIVTMLASIFERQFE